MGKLNLDNLRKTVYYLKKNGIKSTVLAAAERLQKKEYDDYTYTSPSAEELDLGEVASKTAASPKGSCASGRPS